MFKDSKAFSGFSVDDLDAAKDFYRGILGLEVREEPAGLGLQLGGGGTVFIYPKDDHEPATFTILNFPVPDIEAAVDALMAQGVAFERYDGFGQDERGIAAPAPGPSGPGSGMAGPRIAWLRDPAGNILSVIEI